jgi:hypothetical protein
MRATSSRRSKSFSTYSERTMAKKKLTEAERAELKALRERMLANAQRTRDLAERAQAGLEAKRSAE